MRYYFKRLLAWTVIVSAVLASAPASAQDTVGGKYFSTIVHPGVSKTDLLNKLRADYFLQMNAAFSGSDSKNGDIDRLLARTLDAIYLNVSDILDIHMYNFTVELEIFPDKRALMDELGNYTDKKIDVPSFYYHDKNRIYISAADLTLGMLSHETAHAIVCHYFAVQPSVKVQEVLSGYAEYTIRKAVK